MLPVRAHIALGLYAVFLFSVLIHAIPTVLKEASYQNTLIDRPQMAVMGRSSPLHRRLSRIQLEEKQKRDDNGEVQPSDAKEQDQSNPAQTCAGGNCSQLQSARPEDRGEKDDDTIKASSADMVQEPPAPFQPNQPQQKEQEQMDPEEQQQQQAPLPSPPGPLSTDESPSERTKLSSSSTPSTPTGGSTTPLSEDNDGDDEDASNNPPESASPPPSRPAAAAPTASSSRPPPKEKKKPKKPRPVPKDYTSGKTVTIETADDFCLMLPSSPGNRDEYNGQPDPEAIQRSEKSATAFCTSQSSRDAVPGASPMPADFIQSAAMSKTDAYVQVTGTINPGAYELSPGDGGGQYDDHGAGSPPESHCKNYPYYVSLVEPDVSRFCIRCCKTYEDCNAGRSAYGCARVVPE